MLLNYNKTFVSEKAELMNTGMTTLPIVNIFSFIYRQYVPVPNQNKTMTNDYKGN